MKQCSCCNNYTVQEEHDVCEVCLWEKDIISEKNFNEPCGSNNVALKEAMENYIKFRACELRFKDLVRDPYSHEIPQCPCCNNYSVEEEHDICEVCFWEKDVISEKNFNKPSGPNKVSLEKARENYKKYGACELRSNNWVRKPYSYEIPQCPCCHNYTVEKEHDICEVCFWEKDIISEKYPNISSGAHDVSLNEGRQNYKKQGVCEPRFKDLVRKPYPEERPRCPCCNNHTIKKEHDICEVCFWEKDIISEKYSNIPSGSHNVSLKEGIENYKKQGACEPRFKNLVRKPYPDEEPLFESSEI